MSVRQPLNINSLQQATPYAAYSYSYPHKTAYRPINPTIALREAWKGEPLDALYFYVHLPFCEMRCGFCNLFTTANPDEDLVDCYLDALEQQCERVSVAIPNAKFARSAIGGGTPTYLSPRQLDRLFDIINCEFSVDPRQNPMSVETSPRTADIDRLRVLKRRGVARISIGVQSMIDQEVNAAGRAQKREWVHAAIERIRALEFDTLNVDLIYGLPGQSVDSWRESVKQVLEFDPEEVYLYPLYVRPLTGLDRWGEHPHDQLRLACYRDGRDLLRANGYEQLSMRMFRAGRMQEPEGPVYCCQDDGMVGLGCGARSYTRRLHYSSEYAVGASGIKAIIEAYRRKEAEQFNWVEYGCFLDQDEQKRRYIIKSLLRSDGLDPGAYRMRFDSEARKDIPALLDLIECRFVEAGIRLRLTETGMERSDAIGPCLYSDAVRKRMEAYEFQ